MLRALFSSIMLAIVNLSSGSPSAHPNSAHPVVSQDSLPIRLADHPIWDPNLSSDHRKQKKSDLTRRLEAAASPLVSKEIGAPLRAFSCPNQDRLVAGRTFDCQARVEEGTFPVAVTLNDNQGSFNVQTKNLLILAKAEKLLRDGIRERENLTVTANCKRRFYIFKQIGETYNCGLSTSDGRQGSAVLKVTDIAGGVDISYKIE